MVKRKTLLISALVAVAAAALLGWAFRPRAVEVETAAVMTGRFEQAIEEDGRTRFHDRYTVSSPVAARLLRIDLHEGDRVKAGQSVATMVPVMPAALDDRSLREAQARHRAATAAVGGAAARIERARVAVEEARLQLQRDDKLAREGFVSPSRLDSARLALSGAERELQVASAERQVAVQEQAAAAAALVPGDDNVRTGKTMAVRSPVDGVVLRITQPSESTLPAGTALLDVGDPSRLEVVADLLTTDAVQAQPGRRVVIERWGGPAVQGHVRKVEPGAFTKVSALGIEEQRVRVVMDAESPPPQWKLLGDGYRVTVRIITNSLEQAVLVPVGAVFPHGDGGMAVYLADGGKARLQVVELAGRNGSEAAVRSGVKPGQAVVVYPPPTVADGKRLRIRKP